MTDWKKLRKSVLETAFWVAAFSLPVAPMLGGSDEQGARKILGNEGYSELEYRGKASLKYGCLAGGIIRDSFMATDPSGKRAQLTVCQSAIVGGYKIQAFEANGERVGQLPSPTL